MNSRFPAEPTFVGRSLELEQLQQYLRAALEGKGTTILISGEAGAGKTRLVNEFLNLAKKKGTKVIAGWCLSEATVPYFPFMEAFDAYLSAVRDERAKFAVSDHLGILGWLNGPEYAKKSKVFEVFSSPEIRRDNTLEAVTKALLSLSAEEPIILFIDDLHWADSASLSLLHYIARAIVSSRVLVLGTFRREELALVSEKHPHPLIETLRLMSREDLYREIGLPSLSELDVARLAESMLGGNVFSRLIEELARGSQGNPLFAVETLRMLFESGSVVQVDGQWRLSVDKLGIPTKVRDVILHRLASLNPSQRRILDLASVVGEKSDPMLLGAILSLDKLQVLEALHTIAQSTLLIHPEDSCYRFNHSKFREVLYEEISSPLKMEYYARVAESMENLATRAEKVPVNELAFHYAQAGNKEKSVKYSLAAGKDALERFSNIEAAKHFTYVLNTVTEDSKHDNEKIAALEGIGDAYYALGLFEKTTEVFERLNRISSSGTVRLRAIRKAMAASFQRGDFPQSLELASKAEGEAAFDCLEWARVRKIRGEIIGFRGNIKEALRDSRDCLQVFEEENSLPDVARTLLDIVYFLMTECKVEEALHAANHAIVIYKDLKDYRGQVWAYFRAGAAYFNCGLHQDALDCYGKAIGIGEKVGDYNNMAGASLYSSLMYESIGEFEEALSNILKALEYSEKTDSLYIQSAVYGELAKIYSRIGDLEHAEECHKKFTKLFEEASRTASRLLHALGVWMTAAFFAAKGQWNEANRHFDESIGLYKGAIFAPFFEAITRADYARALLKQGRTTDAKMHVEEALRLYGKLGNKTQIARLNPLLAEINKSA